MAQSKTAGNAVAVTRIRAVPVRAKAASTQATPAVLTNPAPIPLPDPVHKPAAALAPVAALPAETAGHRKAPAAILVKKKKPKSPSSMPAFRHPVPLDKPGGSVSDRLRELSGRSYDVYQDRFLSRVRGAIRKIMGSRKGLFSNLPEAAEDLIYNFLKNHYADPYMNWEKSPEKKALEELGFTLDSLIPIIDECYRRL